MVYNWIKEPGLGNLSRNRLCRERSACCKHSGNRTLWWTFFVIHYQYAKQHGRRLGSLTFLYSCPRCTFTRDFVRLGLPLPPTLGFLDGAGKDSWVL